MKSVNCLCNHRCFYNLGFNCDFVFLQGIANWWLNPSILFSLKELKVDGFSVLHYSYTNAGFKFSPLLMTRLGQMCFYCRITSVKQFLEGFLFWGWVCLSPKFLLQNQTSVNSDFLLSKWNWGRGEDCFSFSLNSEVFLTGRVFVNYRRVKFVFLEGF